MSEAFFDSAYPDEGPADTPSPAAAKAKNILALTKDKKKARVIIATAGAIVVVGFFIAATYARHGSKPDTPVPASMTGADVGQAPAQFAQGRNAGVADSPDYQAMTAAIAASAASKAMADGRSSQTNINSVLAGIQTNKTPEQLDLDAIAEKKREADALKAEAAAAAASAALTQGVSYNTPPPMPNGTNQQAVGQMPMPTQASVDRMNAALKMAQTLTSRLPLGPETVAISHVGTTQTNAAGAGAGGLFAAATPGLEASGAAGKVGTVIIQRGDILAVRVDTGVNTDRGNTWRGTVMTGRFAGAHVVGAYALKLDVADMSVTGLSFPVEKFGAVVPSVTAQGIVLDAATLEQGTATDVDRKLLVKYGIKPLATGFAALANYLKTAGTTVVVNGSSVTTANPPLTGKTTSELVLGSAAGQVATDTSALNTTNTAYVDKGTIVGVLFTNDVTVNGGQK